MENSLNMSHNEIIAIQSALETYAEAKNPIVAGIEFRETLRQQLIKSSLQKLETISVLTYFSKQEISIMAFSVQFIIQSAELAPIDDEYRQELYTIFQKLADMADTKNPLQ